MRGYPVLRHVVRAGDPDDAGETDDHKLSEYAVHRRTHLLETGLVEAAFIEMLLVVMASRASSWNLVRMGERYLAARTIGMQLFDGSFARDGLRSRRWSIQLGNDDASES
jgi:hypothetical protein